MKKTILALALVTGLTSFAGNAKAQILNASITTIAYKGLASFNTDGSTNAITTSGVSLPSNPTALAFDDSGNLFSGAVGGVIRKMTADGTVSYFSQSFSGAGSLNGVNGLAFNSAGTLFASITTSAYSGLVSFNSDGSTNAITTSGLTLPSSPTALAFDSTGNLFIGTASGVIRKMTPGGNVSYFSQSFSGAGSLAGVNGLAFNSAGTLFASITTSVYSGLVSFNSNGSTNAITTSGLTLPNKPTALAFDDSGNLFFGTSGGTIGKMTTDGTVSFFSQSFSGTPSFTGVNGLAFQPQSVPEPSTYALFGLGALALVVAYRGKVA
jgi:ligand-binding sensor domain-containing protein